MRKNRKKNQFLSIINQIKNTQIGKNIGIGKELIIFCFFGILFSIIIIKTFIISIIYQSETEEQLNKQHTSISLLKAKRGGIFVLDKSKNPINLTENVTLYNIFLDPKYIGEKNKVIGILTPILYKHFCQYYGLQKIDRLQCIKNLEIFSESKILPEKPEIAYMGSGIVAQNYHQFKDMTGYNQRLEEVIQTFTNDKAEYLIKKGLNDKIKIGVRELNYLAFISNNELIKKLQELNTSYITIKDNNYVYINPHKLSQNQKKREIQRLSRILMKYGYPDVIEFLPKTFKAQENRYVKIASNTNSEIAHEVRKIKEKYYENTFFSIKEGYVPILHGLGLEENTIRYYPLGSFLANALGYLDNKGNAFYGIEEYFNGTLKGIDGEIEGRSSSRIGGVGANEFEVKNVKHGNNLYLTIDVGIQKKIEEIAKRGQENYRADSVSILVYNPFNGQIKATTNYPTFNPNNYNNAYTLKTVTPDLAYTIEDETQLDIPIYIKTGGNTKLANTKERKDNTLKKYIPENIYGSSVFVDKNFSSAYEPGSIFKLITTAIGIDTDEINFYDMYNDPGKILVGVHQIHNADKKNCKGEMPFLDALIYSCNIGMVRIAQKMNRNVFYNYLKKLGFGQKTGIEIANEIGGIVKSPSTISKVGYFNNTFGQGILVTPLQMVSALGTVVNGGYYIKPTLIKAEENPNNGKYTNKKPKIIKQIFKPKTSEQIKKALFAAMEKNPDYIKYVRIEGENLGGKSGTSQIAYKGGYQGGEGRTNASYIGVNNTKNPKYIILVQVRKPRTNQRGVQTAGKLFRQVTKFILSYNATEEELPEEFKKKNLNNTGNNN